VTEAVAHDRLHQTTDVGKVLDRGIGIAVALEHHRLALILVEEDFVLQRAAVPGPHDLQSLLRQALPFLDLAGMKSDPCDSLLRAGDFEGLLAVPDPDLVVRADMASGAPTEISGAAVRAKGAVAYGHLARLTRPALVDGAIGVVVAPQGRLSRALTFKIANGRITEIEVIGDPARLAELDVSIVD